jgi:hypothetical protein
MADEESGGLAFWRTALGPPHQTKRGVHTYGQQDFLAQRKDHSKKLESDLCAKKAEK